MANNNSLGVRSKLSAPAASVKIIPANSPVLKPGTKQPSKLSPYQCTLSLRTVIDSSGLVLQPQGSISTPSYYNNTSTPPTTPDTRSRTLQAALRPAGNGIPSASSPSEWGEAATPRSWTSRERIKAVTSVALSPNGRFLAVGETGYNPRVLIFSTANDSPSDIPLSILAEHTFGVRSLAFSPDSQYLATLGDINDGFLFIWAINVKSGAARLHSANKCTSFIRDMCWLGTNLITVGVRHIKVWRLGDGTPNSPTRSKANSDPANASPVNPGPIALPGRNCILGSLRDSIFTCISNISDTEAIVFCNGLVRLSRRNLSAALIGDLRHSVSRVCSKHRVSTSPKSKHLSTVAMGIVSDYMVMVDSTHAIRVCSLVSPSQCQEDTTQEVDIPAHKDSVLGISAVTAPDIHSSSQFFTWSSNGVVNFWDLEGKCLSTQRVEIEQVLGSSDEPNELKVLRASEDMKTFVSGDKYGVMRRISRESWACEQQVKAHAGEVTDIAIHSSSGLFLTATCGRDRMVQVFQNDGDSFSLIQTMDEHVAAVSRLLFTNDGEKLLSCSADRTVVIRDRMSREIDGTTTVAFFLSKVITLKASPISMTLLPDDSDTLVVSTIDRQIHRYDIPSSRQLHSFKSNDSETSDTVVMSSLIVGSEIAGISPKLIIGVSTTDKSVRVYDFGKDALLTREFGHTEGVSDVLLIETNCGGIQKRTLVSTGLDGIIMIWDLAIQQQQTPLSENVQVAARAEEETPNKESTAVKPPLRRILSRSELAVFQKLDSPSPSPTPIRDPSPPPSRRKTSRYTLYHFARNGTSSSSPQTPPVSLSRRSPTFYLDGNGRNRRDGSVSPPSPKSGSSRTLGTRSSHAKLRRPSIDIRRPKSNGNTSEFGSLNMSTEQVCRTLRAYRKKLHGSTDHLHSATELERELELTARALTERNKRSQTSEDSTDSDNSKLMPPLPSKPVRLARRVPSTPNLGRSRKGDKNSKQIHRTNSLDADGEG
ncbi:WD repeat containing protein [Coccidioides immitis H538.4]|uniref:WD repeat containing protein n=1 Tax=Coccidioides immitis H538.4 TaxID=396776 RepID=A0A0J8S4Z4_COCIT|nr:WD repeat containing protein [Coccidioides immitis H538.4]